MEHKYSTYTLIVLVLLVVGVSVVSSIDGSGSSNYLAKFQSGGRIVNSNVVDNSSGLFYNDSLVCTSTNGVCVGGGINNITYNITNNITIENNITIINNITYNITNNITIDNNFTTINNITYNITNNITNNITSGSTTIWAGRNYTANAGIQNVTGIGFILEANKNYTIDCNLQHQGAVATTGMNLSIDYTGSVKRMYVIYDTWSSATAKVQLRLINVNTIAVGTGSSTTGTHSTLSGGFETITPGTMNISIGTEVSGSLQTLNEYSYCTFTRL